MRSRASRSGTGAALTGVTVAGALLLLARRQLSRRFSFAGRTVLITGGARGLGLALARRLAAEDAVIVLTSRTMAELEKAGKELASQKVRVHWFACDVRDDAAVHRLIDDTIAATGRLDVLINNAGVIQSMPFERATDDDFKDSIDTHFWGPLRLIRAALPHLPDGTGRIVNISLIGGRIAVPHLLPYCVGKFALSALSDGLQAELAPRGISVLTVTPWLMRTGSHRNVVVRGTHAAEASVFALGDATPLTSMAVRRAANQIVEACRRRRARVSPGIQGQLAQVLNVLAPEITAAAMARTAALLPGPGSSQDNPARYSRDLDLGWIAALLPTSAAFNMNQPVAADEASWHSRNH